MILINKLFPKDCNKRYDESYTPFISFVISAYNEEDVIADKLENIKKMEYPADKIEVLIASDGSDDRTVEIIEAAGIPYVKALDYKERRGKVNVLNSVIPEARGEIIVMSDANTMYQPDALRKMIRHFANEKIGCVCGELRLVDNTSDAGGRGEGLYWRYEVFLKNQEGKRGTLLGATGGIFALRKELYRQVPSYTIIEDFVISMKVLEAGYMVVYEPEAVAFEDTPESLTKAMTRRIRIAAGHISAFIDTRALLNPLRGMTAFSYWSRKGLRYLVPWFMVFMLICNIILWPIDLYKYILGLQAAFYLLTIIAYLLNKAGITLRMLGIPLFFVSMNLGILFGYFRFLTGTQKVTWTKGR